MSAADDSRPESIIASADETSADSWHTLTATEVVRRLASDARRGLTEAEASRRLVQFGPNRLVGVHGRRPLTILLAQFRSLIVLLLVAAAIIAFALGEVVEAVAVLVVIGLNALIGFSTEWSAERALKALRRQSVRVAHVVRDGVEREVPAAELVPGDVVIVAAGSRIPADGRVIEAARLQIEEAALTGESQAVTKVTDPIAEVSAVLGDRPCMAFLGTTVTDGRGRILITATGMETEVGRIGRLIEEAGHRATPLERQLEKLGRLLIQVVLGLCVFIVLAGWLRGIDFLHMLEVGISLAIAAVPEGLPAVATMTLAVGVQRMAVQRALIRRLAAVETLGAVTAICTDKTGTLTKNEMTVRALLVDGCRVDVTGTGYDPSGRFLCDEEPITTDSRPGLIVALRIGALCNDARLDRSGGASVLGDPTEAALLVAAEKAGISIAALHRDYPRIDEIPFDSHAKRMTTLHRTPEGRKVSFVKGSPGTVLDRSIAQLRSTGAVPLTPEDRERVLCGNRDLAGASLRVLGLAYRELGERHDRAELDRDVVFVGLVGMMDPLREEAKGAIDTCRAAGIRVLMLTGDQPPTAAEIGRQLGLDRDADDQILATVHARELEGLGAADLSRLVATSSTFARVSPRHKLQVVETLQSSGEIVAMTGDGVNDAPALEQADIGVAMGIKGTEVAKEAADMVITDDNFATIVAAVEQGRIIYANILKFIHYLFSCNFAEIATVFVAILVGWPLPLGPLQILWLNMVTDIFPALALALEPSAPGMMRQPPRDPRSALVSGRVFGLIAWQGALIAAATLVAFSIGLRWHGSGPSGIHRAGTIAFQTLALTQVAHAFNTRSRRRSIFTDRLFTNGWLWAAVIACVMLQVSAVSLPILRRVLQTVPPSPSEWALIAACSLAPVGIVELVKFVLRRQESRRS
jgi:Ca2+-transporting ATPase